MSWESMLNIEAVNFFVKTEFEDVDKVEMFFNLLKERVEDYKVIATIAMKWDKMDDAKKVKLALNYAGVYHASRFMILMDYLNFKGKNGELF